MAQDKQKKLMVVGAHPDDCEQVGGLTLKLKDLGWDIRFLSVTNGSGGHQEMPGAALVKRRRAEADRVAALFGLTYVILEHEDGRLEAGLPQRESLLKEIRAYDPDVLITHRPFDYHPDHRNTSVLVQDCAYLLQVPAICPLAPALKRMPAIFYMQDAFQKPCAFSPDLVFDITDRAEDKLRMYHQHTSQMYEWLPYVDGVDLSTIPEDEAARFEWLRGTQFYTRDEAFARMFGDAWEKKYGRAPQNDAHCEALEICGYGRRLSADELRTLFPF